MSCVILEQPSNDDCWLQRGQNAEECAACVGGRAGNRRAVWGYSILWNSLILGKWEPDLRSHRRIPFNKQPNDCGCEHLSFQRSVWGAFYALLKDSELLSTNLAMFFFFFCASFLFCLSVLERKVFLGGMRVGCEWRGEYYHCVATLNTILQSQSVNLLTGLTGL